MRQILAALAGPLVWCGWCWAAGSAGLAPLPDSTTPREEPLPGPALRGLVEADWLQAAVVPISTRSDAAGGCDGVKNGKYGFHTGLQRNPWWQVDLGAVLPVARVVVYNRLDYAPGLHNADNLQILLSTDGRHWKLSYENHGRHFGGISGGKPLEVVFTGHPAETRFVRLQAASKKPIYLHLDEVEVYGPQPGSPNLALHRNADQSSVSSSWSTDKLPVAATYPVAAWIARGRRLAAHLQGQGVDVKDLVRQLDEAAGRSAALAPAAKEPQRRQLFLDVRWIVRRLAFRNPLLGFDRLLLVKRFTQESYPDVCLNHMPWVSRPGGDICVLAAAQSGTGLAAALADPAPGGERPVARLRYLLNGALGPGHVHGMDLWFDSSRVVFGYARAHSDQPPQGWLDRRESYRLRRTEEPTHLYEVQLDGRRLRQLSGDQWSDLDPTYLPNGEIAFVSERCGTSLQCNEYDKDETSCNLYTMGPDGGNLRRLSVNKDGDYLPHCLDNGLIGYTRWEYHERSWAFIQSLWVIRPDGTGADAIFKQHFTNPWALEDVRSIPGSDKQVAIATGHHTLPVGPLVVIDSTRGINDSHGIGIVTPNVVPPEGGMDGLCVPEGGVADQGGYYATPWPLSEKFFLVSYTYGAQTTNRTGYGLYLVDVFGNKELIYRDPAISCFIPMPLRSRPRPPVLADVTDPAAACATCSVSEIGFGCDCVAPERIRYLRIAEPIGWPYDNHRGGQRYGEKGSRLINWTPIRILGDVPVERDGSAHFRVPADTAVYFQLLDENRMELRRMRSFLSFQPGESRACVGCHESRAIAPRQKPGGKTLALSRGPSDYLPAPWGNRPVSFLRDIQPVLDRQCVSCHGGLRPAGGLDFCGGLTDWSRAVEKAWGLIPGYGFNRAFETITAKRLVACSAPNAQDASITPPLAYGSHKSKLLLALSDKDHRNRVHLSADEHLRLAMWIDANAPYHDRFVNKRPEATPYDLAADSSLYDRLLAVHARRCAGCHQAAEVTRLDWIDIRNPPRSLFLTACLAKTAGGTERCRRAVYQDTADPDYQAALELTAGAAAKTWRHPRRDVQALKNDFPGPFGSTAER